MPVHWIPSDDPRVPIPTRAEMQAALVKAGGDEQRVADGLNKYRLAREEFLDAVRIDPLRQGYEPPTYKILDEALADAAEVLVSGANREGKSYGCVKRLVGYACNNPNRIVAMFEATQDTSIIKQQAVVYQMLPPEWRTLGKKGRMIDISYTKKNGFSEGRLVLPNESMILFYNYSQDVAKFEGFEFDKVYFPENVPLGFVQTMKYRTGSGRNLQVIYDFTPKWGFTPVLQEILKGMTIVKTARAPMLSEHTVHVPGCPPGHMPVIMECKERRSKAVFFHNGTNPMGQGDQIRQKLAKASTDEIMIRGYGYARRFIGGAFARFGPIHCITRAQFDKIALEDKDGVRYCCADPGGSKNWLIHWYFVTKHGHVIVYREWPDFQRHGEWAIPPDKGIDWKPGPAQRSEYGRGIREYKEMILEAEGARWTGKEWDMAKAEQIAARWLDPRFGDSEVPGQEDGTTIIDLLFDEQKNSDGLVSGISMEWGAASCGRYVDDTVQMINERLSWNENQPLSVLNCPRLYFVDDLCQTTLAMKEWAGEMSTAKCALKDCIDPLRYFCKENPDGVDAQETMITAGAYE